MATVATLLLFVAVLIGSMIPGGQASAQEAKAEDGAAAESSAESPDYARNGGWVGLGGAFALEHFDRRGSYEDSGALAFRAGYRGLPNVAVEMLGEVLPHFDGDGSRDGDVDGFLVSVNGKLFLPLGRVEPWVMGGLGFLNINANHRDREDDFAFRFAGGLDAYLTEHWAIYLEAAYVLPTGEISEYRYSTYGAGFLFRF
jgi:hypothetical protein